MTPIRIEDSGSSATIALDYGFNCFEFKANVGGEVLDVLDTLPVFFEGGRRPNASGIPILFPFPNRIRDGRFTWEGQEYVIPASVERPKAIHGFALDMPWRLIDQGRNFAVGEWQLSVDAPERSGWWPTDCLIQVGYALHGARLISKIRIENPDARPMPWGFGTHTYFKLPLSPEGRWEECLVQAPAHQKWVLDETLNPTGERIPVPADKDIRRGAFLGREPFDDVYGDLRPEGNALECVMMDQRGGFEIVQRCDPIFRELVVFTPPNRHAVCMEPYTCVTDAVNLQARGVEAGWRVLEPRGEVTTWIDIVVRRITA